MPSRFSILAATSAFTTTMAGAALAGSLSLAPAAAPSQAVLHGTVSLRALASSAANQASPAPHRALTLPIHRFPDGAATRIARALLRPDGTRVVPVTAGAPAGHTASGFTGIYEGLNAATIGGELEPPDQGLAVSNGQVFEIVNNTLQVYNTKGKPLSAAVSNATFFGVDPSNLLSDPHVVYDPTTQRWFVEELYASSSFNGFVVAISQSSDPLGSYYVYQVSAATESIAACAGSCLPDYPQVGYDTNGFYITADLFSNTTGQFVAAAVYALPKGGLEAGGTVNYVYFLSNDFVIQPSIPAPGQPFATAANGTEYLMSARNIFDGSTNVRVFAVTNTNNLASNPTSLKASAVDVAAEAYTSTVPSTQPDVIGPYGQSVGATSAPQLDGGYNAFGGGVKYAANALYGALASGATDSKGMARDVIAWFALTPSVSASGAVSATIKAQGYETPGTGFSLSFPSFALNKSGQGILGFSITNPNKSVVGGYPSTALSEFTGTATTGPIYVIGKGATSDDGFTGYPGAGPAGVGRWGDYGGGTVDATTGYYYFGNEFIPDPVKYPRGTYANWGTFLTQAH